MHPLGTEQAFSCIKRCAAVWSTENARSRPAVAWKGKRAGEAAGEVAHTTGHRGSSIVSRGAGLQRQQADRSLMTRKQDVLHDTLRLAQLLCIVDDECCRPPSAALVVACCRLQRRKRAAEPRWPLYAHACAQD